MIKNHKFLSLFAITLVAALLLFMSGKATSVYALADPVQAISPIYDTQIYQLKDYIDNGGLSSGQLDIFYTLAGFYVLGQAGSTGYRLVDPYTNSNSVWDWLKSCGIELYNTVIGLIPDTARMPITGDIYSTIPFKKASQLYVATLMGAAVKAATYSDFNTFKSEVESGSYYLPWNLDVQKGMNSIFGIYDGIYQWQFDSNPFSTSVAYKTHSMTSSSANAYASYRLQLMDPVVRSNYSGNDYNTLYAGYGLNDYNILFLNTDTQKFSIVNSSGQRPGSSASDFLVQYLYYSANSDRARFYDPGSREFFSVEYTYPSLNTLRDSVQWIYDNNNFSNFFLYLEDFVTHVYAGTNWLNKTEIFNITNLNFDESDQQYYTTVPDTNDYLLDIYGILQDILNETDLTNIILNNIVDIDGVPVHDEDLIRITTNIYNLLEVTNPVMPVNLNDISDYTENTYLDLVKQHGQNFGETIGEYVVFWHNADPEITYVIFGAFILTLIGAFVGKWGHS